MSHETAFASIRQGDLAAADAWKLLAPIVVGADGFTASRICDVLRAWAWKALDRRRRDQGLREWVDVLNRVEAFFEGRFSTAATKIVVLAELLHESLEVAEIADSAALLRRRHVQSILDMLCSGEGRWTERAELMGALDLKPANTTRLMTLLVDVGWAEQAINGREAAYRISTEGAAMARCILREDDEEAASEDLLAGHCDAEPWEGFEFARLTGIIVPKHVRRDPIVLAGSTDLPLNRPDYDWKRVGRETLIPGTILDIDEDAMLDDEEDARFRTPAPSMIMTESA